MDRLNREEFVKAVAARTHKTDAFSGDPEDVLAGKWFDLVTASEAKGKIAEIATGLEINSPVRRVPTHRVIYRGALSTKCVPDEVSLWYREVSFSSTLFVGPISSKSLRDAMVPKVKSQEAQAARLIKDILKGYARRNPTKLDFTGDLYTSVCVLTIEDENTGEHTVYFGSFCDWPFFMFKLDMGSITMSELVDLYVNRLMQFGSKSWQLAFREGSLLYGAPPGVDWKIFRGGITAALSPRVKVFIEHRHLLIIVDDFYRHDCFASSYQTILENLYDEVASSVTRKLVLDVDEDTFKSIVNDLPAALFENIVKMAEEDAASFTNHIRVSEEHHAKHMVTLGKIRDRAEAVCKLLKGGS